MKRGIGLLLTLALLMLSAMPVTAEDQALLYEYELLEDGTVRLTEINDLSEVMVIPDTVYGYTVSELGDCLFLRRSNLRTVVVPDTVRVIGAGAFQETRIEQVFLPEGLEIIERQAFFCCPELKQVVIPSTVTSIGEHALGFGYYQDPAYPDLIPGSVGVREDFTLISDGSEAAEIYAAQTGVSLHVTTDYQPGDADFDGAVTSRDARTLLSVLIHEYTRRWTVADMNGNGVVDTTDVRLLLTGLVSA
ncbi:MAG: leucine-rich repeat protein [Clostridia bacterium]|nr:leucine-rich repeat protein [Clostridia bacterium]